MTGTLSSTFPRSIPPSLLILILDIHPLSWSLLSSPTQTDEDDEDDPLIPKPPVEGLNTAPVKKVPISPISLPEFINILLVFLNSHLASRWGNRVVVFAASAGKSKLLYPTNKEETDEEEGGGGANVYHPFGMLNKGLEEGLREMIVDEGERMDDTDGEGLNGELTPKFPSCEAYELMCIDPPAIVSAMTKALCYINRNAPPPTSESTIPTNETRILVINATPGAGSNSSDNSGGGGGGMRGGYVGLMNCVFAAQKAKIPIDVLTLPPPSTGTEAPIFLQQASHLTEGVYWRWNGRGGLLQYLHVSPLQMYRFDRC
jgi:transcription initiation factor TFIIH subunit 3